MVAVSGVAQRIDVGSGAGLPFTPDSPDLLIFDAEQWRPPTALTIAIFGGEPLTTWTLSIDAIEVYTVQIDAEGELNGVSIPVDDDKGFMAGEHILSATDGVTTLSATFTLARGSSSYPPAKVQDADPIFLPESQVGDRFRWVMQDLMPGGLGSWIMPMNPMSMTPPHVRKNVVVTHTTSPAEGRVLINETHLPPIDWSFAGYCPNEDFYNKLQAYANLNRRFFIIDHRCRAWVVAGTGVEIKPRKRQREDGGTFNDWAGDYTFTAMLLEEKWEVPQ